MASLFLLGSVPALTHASDCPGSGDLNFLCEADRPEDLKHIPGSRWLITSGFSAGAGLKLVDMRRKSLTRWFSAAPDQIGLDAARYPDCASPPDPALFNARGLSLRMAGKAKGRLHVINHGGRESVEVFDIDASRASAAPRLMWRGCLRLPKGHVGNAVATYADGTVLVTVLTQPGMTITDFEQGRNTGGVFERKPGESDFRLIPGTALPGNNGLETAQDDSGFFVVAFGLRSVLRFDRTGAIGPRATYKAPGFMPDNVHWTGGRLIAAGMAADEPACGGVRQIINGVADTMKCPRGYSVAALDPATGQWTVIATGPRNAAHNGVSAAVITGKTLWLGSYQANRLAWRTLKQDRTR